MSPNLGLLLRVLEFACLAPRAWRMGLPQVHSAGLSVIAIRTMRITLVILSDVWPKTIIPLETLSSFVAAKGSGSVVSFRVSQYRNASVPAEFARGLFSLPVLWGFVWSLRLLRYSMNKLFAFTCCCWLRCWGCCSSCGCKRGLLLLQLLLGTCCSSKATC